MRAGKNRVSAALNYSIISIAVPYGKLAHQRSASLIFMPLWEKETVMLFHVTNEHDHESCPGRDGMGSDAAREAQN